MNFIDWLADNIAMWITNGIIKYGGSNLRENDLVLLMEKIRIKFNKIKELTEQGIYESAKYALQAILGESFKLLIVLLFAWLFDIILPTLVVMMIFSLLRIIAGGNHLHSSTKCLVFTTICILCVGYWANIFTYNFTWYNKIYAYLGYGIILEFISTTKGFENVLEILDTNEKKVLTESK